MVVLFNSNYFAPGMGAKYCGQCLFVCLSAISKTTVQISPIFLYMLLVAMDQCDKSCTSGFVDDVIFQIIERTGRIRDDTHVWSSSPGGGTGAKSAVFD